jgi:Predicted transcriptional regulators
MAIGERIYFFRTLRGMTQKYLGMLVGFDKKNADVRLTQYECGTRTPKENLARKFAYALDVSPHALNVPDIDSNIGLMHTLFTLEDLRAFKITEINGEICLKLDKSQDLTYREMRRMLSSWHKQAAKLESGEISKEEYDKWRYNYPDFDDSRIWVKNGISQELSDWMNNERKK